jgi:hypothetical protein
MSHFAQRKGGSTPFLPLNFDFLVCRFFGSIIGSYLAMLHSSDGLRIKDGEINDLSIFIYVVVHHVLL